MNREQLTRVRSGQGFFAALDQSGGSTPRMLAAYGIAETAYANDTEMFDLVHEMRARIMRSPRFDRARIVATILFEDTLDRQIDGEETAEFLWQGKGIVPILKVDKGLEPETDGVQLMRPIPGLGPVLARARTVDIFGTKMRSFITQPDPAGITAIVDQQFDVANEILSSGFVPIVEPEIDIHSPGKSEAEQLLKAAIRARLDALPPDQQVVLKLSLPDQDDFYADLVEHPGVLRVLALSGGFDRKEAVERLARNHGVIASFSRALLEGLAVTQTEAEFDATLDDAVEGIYQASLT